MAERLQPDHTTPEHVQASPEAQPTDFQLLMRKLLDLPDHRTEGPAAKTMEELSERIKSDPLQAVTELDAYLRRRKTGNLVDWTARNVTNVMINAAATSVDKIDGITESLNSTPPGAMAAAGVEYVTDTLISAGSNFLMEKATGIKGVRYASPLSEIISTGANTMPVFRQYINGVNIEASLRLFESIPVLGALLERGHIAGDRMINQALETQHGKWFSGLLIVMSKGFNNPKSGEKKSAPTGPSSPPNNPQPPDGTNPPFEAAQQATVSNTAAA